jgi:hypothetical protein
LNQGGAKVPPCFVIHPPQRPNHQATKSEVTPLVLPFSAAFRQESDNNPTMLFYMGLSMFSQVRFWAAQP